MVFPELPSCNFLIFPTVSSISLVFPSLPFIVSSRLIVFSQCSAIFLHFPPVFNDFPSFSLVLSYFFPSAFKGPRENRTPPSPNCLVVHAPLKIPIGDPNHQLISRFRCTWATTPPHALYSLRSGKQLCLTYRLVFVIWQTCLHAPFLSHLSLLCNPSPVLPRYHSSSPCKPSCSEPQRTLLSV